MNRSSFFVDDAATAALQTRVPLANVVSGMFGGASCAPGIGIATENPGLDESQPNWTLLDQFGNARDDQRGQHIGGPGISAPSQSDGMEQTLPAATVRLYDNTTQTGDGGMTFPAPGAELVDLAVGWVESA